MIILIFLVAAIGLLIVKAVQVQRQLSRKTYSWQRFSILAVAFLVLVLPGVRIACSEIECRWSIKFGWLLTLIQQVSQAEQNASPVILLALAMTTAAVLGVYCLGHMVGWTFYGFRKLVATAQSAR